MTEELGYLYDKIHDLDNQNIHIENQLGQLATTVAILAGRIHELSARLGIPPTDTEPTA